MPQMEVVLFMEDDSTVPLYEWLDKQPEKVQVKLMERVERLEEKGYEMRRPLADILRDKIYELRVGFNSKHYRILYFFCLDRAVLSHGLLKERIVPNKEIDLAIKRREKYKKDPKRHTYVE